MQRLAVRMRNLFSITEWDHLENPTIVFISRVQLRFTLTPTSSGREDGYVPSGLLRNLASEESL